MAIEVAKALDGRPLVYIEGRKRRYELGGVQTALSSIHSLDAGGQLVWRDEAVRLWVKVQQAPWQTPPLPGETASPSATTKTASPSASTKSSWGALNTAMICPHCNTPGGVRTKSTKQKRGISGGKVTAAIFTAGASLMYTGLSRKERMTQAHCTRCNNTWLF